MALDQYSIRTRLLLNDPSFEVYNDGDVTTYINIARGQIAGQAECCRVLGTLAVDGSTQQYPFSLIDLTLSGSLTVSGIQGVLNVRQAAYSIASGQKNVFSRPFPWFNQYVLSQPVPDASFPQTWSQYGQASLGSVYINLLDTAYMLSLDCVCYPVDLTDDSTAEAIPYQFTDGIPFFAAYYASMTIGDKDRADAMFEEFGKFMARARSAASPAVLPGSFAQPADPFMQNRLGLQVGRQQT